MREQLSFDEEETAMIKDYYYNQGKTLSNIASIFGCSYTGMLNFFIRNNWERFQDRRNRKYYFNEHVFDDIDTPDKAFCLGLLLADGCNHSNNNDVSIELQKRDVEVLQMMNNVFESTYPIHEQKASGSRVQDTCTLRVTSKHFSERCSEIGFVPRKSLILDFPIIKEEFIMNMLNGYIAGDGWVNKYCIGFMSTDKFCYKAQEYLETIGIKMSVYDLKKERYNEHTKMTQISGKKNIIPFVEKMLDGCNIFLRRKYDKLVEYGHYDLNKAIVAQRPAVEM